MHCRICDHPQLDFQLAVGDVRYRTSESCFQVLRCAGCGVLVTTLDGRHIDPREVYPEDYGVRRVAKQPRTMRRFHIAARMRRLLRTSYVAPDRLAWVEKLGLPRGARVLDVGCGRGETGAWLARDHDLEVVGIEPHAPAAQASREQGLRVHSGTLDDFEGEGGFDAVLMIHVLEHVPDPLGVLRRVRRLLRPGGRLVIALPNSGSLERHLFGASWDGWDIPRHVHHFNVASLRHLLGTAGFEISDLAFEWYSIFSRSLANRRHPELDHRQRTKRAPWHRLERSWGLVQAILRVSSALQVIAMPSRQ